MTFIKYTQFIMAGIIRHSLKRLKAYHNWYTAVCPPVIKTWISKLLACLVITDYCQLNFI